MAIIDMIDFGWHALLAASSLSPLTTAAHRRDKVPAGKARLLEKCRQFVSLKKNHFPDIHRRLEIWVFHVEK